MSKSNWTLRHPRSLDEAFGAGTSRNFAEPDDARWAPQDLAITVIGGICVIVLITLPLLGWMR